MDIPPFVEAFLDRSDWGADPLTPRAGYPIPWEQVVGEVLHHTVMVLQDYDRDGHLRGDVDDVAHYMRVLQHVRPDLGDEVPYTDVIFPGSTPETCIVAVGRGPGRTGSHTAGLNSTRAAIAVAGNTDVDAPFTPGMIAGFRWIASVRLVDPIGAVATIDHQHAPPYYDSKGNNLNATGCAGDNGRAHLPELQPPFYPYIPGPTPAPTTGDWFDMATLDDLRRVVAEQIRPMLWHEAGTDKVWHVPPGGDTKKWVPDPQTFDEQVIQRGCVVVWNVPPGQFKMLTDVSETPDGIRMIVAELEALPSAISYELGQALSGG